MADLIDHEEFSALAPAGYYVALRVGFAFPLIEVNALPDDWVAHYTAQRFMLFDPVIRWLYANVGATRWSEIGLDDDREVIAQARDYGLHHGIAISCFDDMSDGQRSFGSFVRGDRDFEVDEIEVLHEHMWRLHRESAPPSNLTDAELEVLRMVKDGMRLKQIAHEIGVTEGAVKQRLRNAKTKLRAQTGAQAAAKAHEFGLL